MELEVLVEAARLQVKALAEAAGLPPVAVACEAKTLEALVEQLQAAEEALPEAARKQLQLQVRLWRRSEFLPALRKLPWAAAEEGLLLLALVETLCTASASEATLRQHWLPRCYKSQWHGPQGGLPQRVLKAVGRRGLALKPLKRKPQEEEPFVHLCKKRGDYFYRPPLEQFFGRLETAFTVAGTGDKHFSAPLAKARCSLFLQSLLLRLPDAQGRQEPLNLGTYLQQREAFKRFTAFTVATTTERLPLAVVQPRPLQLADGTLTLSVAVGPHLAAHFSTRPLTKRERQRLTARLPQESFRRCRRGEVLYGLPDPQERLFPRETPRRALEV